MTPLKLIREEGSDWSVPLPAYETDLAAGADIRANLPEDLRKSGLTLQPRGRALVPTGLRMEIPKGFEVQLRPRSGLALRDGITLLNSPGTIDADYRGPVGIIVINHSDASFTVTHGMRIAQMVLATVVRAQIDLAVTISETPRGAGGFGSTGRT